MRSQLLHQGRVSIKDGPLKLRNTSITSLLSERRIDARNLAWHGILCGITTHTGKRVSSNLVLPLIEEGREKCLSSAIGRTKSIDDAMTAETSSGTDGSIAKATPFALISGQGLNGSLKTTRDSRARISARHN